LKTPFHSISKRSFFFLTAICLVLTLFCQFPYRAIALSIEEERILGEKFLTQIRAHFELVNDGFLNDYINDLGHYLIKPLETKPFPFNFYIIKDNSLNAFAAPGGHIFIFSGLIDVMDEVDELAAVLSHEIGHVSARHLSQRIEQSKKISLATVAMILAGIFIGGDVGQALTTGSVAAGMQAQLHYSRIDERQADQLGFKYMTEASFDPSSMIVILRKIERGYWLGTDKVPPYLLTHPTGPERMANLDAMLSQHFAGSSNKEITQFINLFPLFKTVIQANCLDPPDAERRFNLQLAETPGSYLPHLGLGIVYTAKSDYGKAIFHLQKAYRQTSRIIPVLTYLGNAYQMNGQNKEAVKILQEALRLNDQDKGALYLLGLSYENLGDYQKAIQIFERLSALNQTRTDVYYHLGIVYGKVRQLGLAHYNFGIYFKALGQMQNASFHFRKAETLSVNNPELKEKIRKAKGEASS
jgi:predicted Zn-dependent protease